MSWGAQPAGATVSCRYLDSPLRDAAQPGPAERFRVRAPISPAGSWGPKILLWGALKTSAQVCFRSGAWDSLLLPPSFSLPPSLQQHVALSPFPKGVLQGSASEIRGRFERRNPRFDPCSIERPFVPLQSSALCIGLAASGGKRCRKQGFILLLTIGSSSVLWCLHCPKVFECKAHT